jgi:hypothetical protein
VPDLPSLAELWAESAIVVPCDKTIIHEGTLIEGRLVSETAFADALERIYRDPR